MAAKHRRVPESKVTESKATSTPTLKAPSRFDFLTILALAVIAIAFIIRMNWLELPMERDEGSYAYMGREAMFGGRPYIDFYEMKPPGIFYMYGLLDWISGGTLKGIHFVFFLLNAITGIFLFYWVRLWMGTLSATLAAITFAMITLSAGASGFTVQAEHLVSCFAVIGCYFLWRAKESNSHWHWILSGIGLATALMIKPNGALFVVFAALVFYLHHLPLNGKTFWGGFIQPALWMKAGAIALIALCILPVWMKGGLQQMWFWLLEFPKSAYLTSVDDATAKKLFNSAWRNVTEGYEPFWYLAMIGIVAYLLAAKDWKSRILFISFILLSFISITPGRRFYGHYWLHLMPAVAIAVGGLFYGIKVLMEKIGMGAKASWVGIISALLLVLFNINANKIYYFHPDPIAIHRSTYGDNPFPESLELSKYLNAHMKPEETLSVIGSEPQFYWYTNKSCMHPHSFIGFLTKGHPKNPKWIEEVKTAHDKKNPDYYVLVNHPFSWGFNPQGDQTFAAWAWEFPAKHGYIPVAWAETQKDGSINYLYDAEAQNHQATTEKWICIFKKVDLSGLGGK